MTGVRVGVLGGCWYCVERKKKKTTLFTEKLPPASGLPGGDRGPLLGKQEARISRTCQATRRPLAPASANSHSFCQSSAAPLVRPCLVHPSGWLLRPPAFRQSCLPKLAVWRLGLSFRGADTSQNSAVTFYPAVNLTGTASLLMPLSMSHQSLREAH